MSQVQTINKKITLTPSEWIDLVVSRRNLDRTSGYSVKCLDTGEEYTVDSQALQQWASECQKQEPQTANSNSRF